MRWRRPASVCALALLVTLLSPATARAVNLPTGFEELVVWRQHRTHRHHQHAGRRHDLAGRQRHQLLRLGHGRPRRSAAALGLSWKLVLQHCPSNCHPWRAAAHGRIHHQRRDLQPDGDCGVQQLHQRDLPPEQGWAALPLPVLVRGRGTDAQHHRPGHRGHLDGEVQERLGHPAHAPALWLGMGRARGPHPQTAPWSAPPTRAAYLARAPRA
jgi:hypothetical protein